MPPCLANFCIFSRNGFHHIGQVDLKLLTLGDPPASASQSVEITGVNHHAQLSVVFKKDEILLNTPIFKRIICPIAFKFAGGGLWVAATNWSTP